MSNVGHGGAVGRRGMTPAAEPEKAVDMELLRALRELDPHDDMHWTKDGQPAMAELERLLGSRKVTREDVAAITGDAKRPQPGEPVPDFYRQPIPSPGRIVMVRYPEAPEAWPAIVSKVNDDGSINAHIFLAEAAATFATGLRNKHELEKLPDGDAGRNVPSWEWPQRS